MNADKQFPQLKDGCEWADHEDCLIGDEEGLRNLKEACENALEKGECFRDDLGDYVGVKVLPSRWFKNPTDSPKTSFSNSMLAVVLFVILGMTIVGFITVFKWPL